MTVRVSSVWVQVKIKPDPNWPNEVEVTVRVFSVWVQVKIKPDPRWPNEIEVTVRVLSVWVQVKIKPDSRWSNVVEVTVRVFSGWVQVKITPDPCWPNEIKVIYSTYTWTLIEGKLHNYGTTTYHWKIYGGHCEISAINIKASQSTRILWEGSCNADLHKKSVEMQCTTIQKAVWQGVNINIRWTTDSVINPASAGSFKLITEHDKTDIKYGGPW